MEATLSPGAERELREFLWLNHGCDISHLYGDDGRLDCNHCRRSFAAEPTVFGHPTDLESVLRWTLSHRTSRGMEQLSLAAELRDARAEIEQLKNVPGHWRCPKCSFYNVRSVISASSGEVSRDPRTGRSVCPNDGADMVAVTWDELTEGMRAENAGLREKVANTQKQRDHWRRENSDNMEKLEAAERARDAMDANIQVEQLTAALRKARDSAGCCPRCGTPDDEHATDCPTGRALSGSPGTPLLDVARAVLRDFESPTFRYVYAFALRMEERLRDNAHKGNREGWADSAPPWLFGRMLEEMSELGHQVATDWKPCGCRSVGECDHDDTGCGENVDREAADVANFAMMIADTRGTLSDVAPVIQAVDAITGAQRAMLEVGGP